MDKRLKSSALPHRIFSYIIILFLLKLSLLAIRLLDVHQRNVLVAVSGVRILLRSVRPCAIRYLGELDGFLWTVLYASETKLAIALYLDAVFAS